MFKHDLVICKSPMFAPVNHPCGESSAEYQYLYACEIYIQKTRTFKNNDFREVRNTNIQQCVIWDPKFLEYAYKISSMPN